MARFSRFVASTWDLLMSPFVTVMFRLDAWAARCDERANRS